MSARGPACCVLLAALALGPAFAQEQGASKKPKAKVEDAIARVVRKAKEHDEAKLKRVTTAPNDGEMLVVAEFETGDIIIGVCFGDASDDQSITLTKQNVALVKEAVERSSPTWGR